MEFRALSCLMIPHAASHVTDNGYGKYPEVPPFRGMEHGSQCLGAVPGFDLTNEA